MDKDAVHTRVTRWSRGLVITGIVIAVLNMSLAWVMLFFGQPFLRTEQLEQFARTQLSAPLSATDAGASSPPDSAASDQIAGLEPSERWLHKMLEMFQQESEIQARQTTLLLAFCFALVAIGFSLFVMGIEGALAFRGDAREFGSVALKVSSPGLFCIFLAALLIALSLGNRFDEVSTQLPESKVDIIQAESLGKEQVIRAEADAKEQVLRAEAEARERVIEAEMAARQRASPE